jgi:polyhydroxybutyrate depolymerase
VLEQGALMSGGLLRTYLLYVPPGDSSSHRLPLVLVYHGALENAWVPAETTTNLVSIDEQRHNMILVFLQGYENTWNDDAGDPPAEAAGVNDVSFTTAVLSKIESSYFVNPREVVATGVSNGAILTELLGCRISADLTLIVPVEGQLAPTFSSSCRPRKPISVYEIHATADQYIPYKGGTFTGVGGPVKVLSAPASAARWATLDGCANTGAKSRSSDSVLTKYKGCREGVRVTLDSIQGGSHEFPPNFGGLVVRLLASLTGKRQATRL